MDHDSLYYHFVNLGLALIGLLSIHTILDPFVFMMLMLGITVGFFASWQMKGSRFQYVDMFIGMLSLAAVVIILGKLYDISITFENLLKIFSTTLAWLMLFQSFGLRRGKSYVILQFISVSLLISSVGLALEGEAFYIVLLTTFLFIFIFTTRLDLVCEKKRKGSLIIGDRLQILSLWQQIKISAMMFSFVLIVASLAYPFVPRFENLSLNWVPSTLLGIPEKVLLLRLSKGPSPTIKEERKIKEEQPIDDQSKKRETSGDDTREDEFRKTKKDKEEVVKRFPAKKFDKNINIFKTESLIINSDKDKVLLGSQAKLKAELRMKDDSIIPATQLVDWKVTGNRDVSIDNEGNFTPKKEGYAVVSASYMGNFSNDIKIEVTSPPGPIKKRTWAWYLFLSLFYLLIVVFLCLTMWVFMRSRRLSELSVKNPKQFIKEIYTALCRAFRFYGRPKFDYMAHREFFESVKEILSSRPEPMGLMTEGLMEACFSAHEISTEHSRKTLGLFHEVKEVVLQREGRKEYWKKILFTVFLLDVLMMPKH